MAKLFKTIGLRDATGFVRSLDLANDRWNPIPDRWIFRGQGDASWPLLPGAFRSNSAKPLILRLDGPIRLPARTYGEQLRAELRLLLRFLSHADDQGLPLPPGAQEYLGPERLKFLNLHVFEAIPMFGGQAFPPDDLLPSLALAQHHGVPTRLLDWSQNPLAAAYFAATQCLRSGGHSRKRLAVFALDAGYVNAFADRQSNTLLTYRPPRHGNQNLVAQEGTFTFHRTLAGQTEPADARPVEQALHSLLAFNFLKKVGDRIPERPPRLLKLTLPMSEAAKLLEALTLRRVDANRLFPGYDGAARALFDEGIYPPVKRPPNLVEPGLHPSTRMRSDVIVVTAPKVPSAE
jgi:hypothetical protein